MKRKYTRKNVQLKSGIVKPSVNGKLPPDILESIEKTCKTRKALGLFDDREERIERALRYQEFRMER
jgi:hypothetical protein